MTAFAALLFLSALSENVMLPVTQRAWLVKRKAAGHNDSLDELSDPCWLVPALLALGFMCLWVAAGGAPDVLALQGAYWPAVLGAGLGLILISFVVRGWVERREAHREATSSES